VWRLQRRTALSTKAVTPSRRRASTNPGRARYAPRPAAALRAEGEAKAQGRTALQDKVARLNEESAQHSARLAGLEGEQSALSQSVGELERLRDDLSGDTASRAAMIGQFEEQNSYLTRRIEEEELRLQALREASREGTAAIRRLNEEKLALEGERNRADKEIRDKNDELVRMEGEVSNLENKAAAAALAECARSGVRDWNGLKLSIRDCLSDYIFKKTKRSPMILPVIMEV